VTFELTELGGEAWEEFAEPDWARFLDQLSDLTDVGAGEMTSPDLTLMMAYMGWFPPFADHQVKPETVKSRARNRLSNSLLEAPSACLPRHF
jgi:hypothetical protein